MGKKSASVTSTALGKHFSCQFTIRRRIRLRIHTMPIRLESPLLSIDAGQLHKVDTRNVENLFGMWSGECSRNESTPGLQTDPGILEPVFSRCAESIEDGRRLENLSWRLWNRETLCCELQPHFTTTPAIDTARKPDRSDIPELSASVDSVASDVARSVPDQPLRSAPVDIVPQTSITCASARSRGREKHITSFGLERMVFSIKEKQRLEPLSPRIAEALPTLFPTTTTTDVTPRPESPSLQAPLRSSDSSTSTAPLSGSDSDRSPMNTTGSDTSADLHLSHSVVRGFSPNLISSSYRSHTHLAPSSIPPKHIPLAKTGEAKKGDMFLLGGSSDDGSSLEDRLFHQPRQSSLTAGLRRPLASKKQTSFRDEVESRTINQKLVADEEVFESDDEVDASESAIDDDEDDEDGSEWEDSVSDGGEGPGHEKHLFQRVDSRPHLVSRPSLLTTLITQGERAAAFASKASKSSPALRRFEVQPTSDSSANSSLDEESTLTMPSRSKMTPSRPIIMTGSNTHPPTLSPRTTRRNMLATELTESLRKHLLWERQQKSTTANAVLKRRHTAFDVSNLQEYPGQKSDASKNNSWNHYFDHGSGEYHQAGW